jgi:hypothetical protein
MNYVSGLDCSQFNGTLNWPKVTEKIAMIKMGGGDGGHLYLDNMATKNYYGAKAAGKAVGGYWFAGGGNPITEADYFIRAMSPLAVGDVFALDWEVSHVNPVQWCLQFVTEVHKKTGCWPLLYINESTCNAYNWEPVLKNCGLWIADYEVSPDANVPIKYTYVMHQYSDTPYDHDAWFGTVDQFKAYGYKPATTETVTAAKPAAPTTVLGKIGSTLPTPPVPAPSTIVTPTATPLDPATLIDPITPIVNQPTYIPIEIAPTTSTTVPVQTPPPPETEQATVWTRFINWFKELW